MLSRVADSVYWMSRYIERAENVARFVHVNLNLMLDFPIPVDQQQWRPLIAASGDDEDFDKRYSDHSEKNVIEFLTFDRENPNSIFSCVHAARENGRTIRDTISSEMWEQINSFYLMVDMYSRKRQEIDYQSFFSQVKRASHLFVGIADTTMSHGEGWHFARMGRLMERADKTARILDVKYFMLLPNADYVDTPFDAILWGALLKSTSAFEMYRKRYNKIHHRNVAEFLISDPHFPRSLKYCVRVAGLSLAAIVAQMADDPHAVKEMKELNKMVNKADIDAIVNGGIHEFVDAFQFNLNVVGQEIYNSFVALKDKSQTGPNQSQSQS